MKNVFIDTSIFEANNFLEGNRIRELFRLAAEKEIRIVLPEITLNEILNRLEKHVHRALGRYKHLRDDFKILRNSNSLKDRFSSLHINEHYKTQITEEIKEILQKQLNETVVILPYPTVDLKGVFDNYFNSKYPFNKRDKKHEFPDAFALISLEQWCDSQKQECIVLSTDTDLLNYESKRLTIPKDYGLFLDKLLRDIEENQRLQNAITLYDVNKEYFEKHIEQWLIDELMDETTYYDAVNGMEIHEIDISDLEIDISEIRFVTVTASNLEMENIATVEYRTVLKIDDENFVHYDDDDGSYHYYETKKEVLRGTLSIPVLYKIETPLAGAEFADIEIGQINNGKSLEL